MLIDETPAKPPLLMTLEGDNEHPCPQLFSTLALYGRVHQGRRWQFKDVPSQAPISGGAGGVCCPVGSKRCGI